MGIYIYILGYTRHCNYQVLSFPDRVQKLAGDAILPQLAQRNARVEEGHVVPELPSFFGFRALVSFALRECGMDFRGC